MTFYNVTYDASFESVNVKRKLYNYNCLLYLLVQKPFKFELKDFNLKKVFKLLTF